MDNLQEIYNERMEEEYESIPKPRPPETKEESKARTYTQSLVEKYEKHFNWSNPTFFKDRALLYIKANQLVKKKSDSQLKSILDWTVGKKLHPLSVIKIINKALL